jgi:hypothetical protein
MQGPLHAGDDKKSVASESSSSLLLRTSRKNCLERACASPSVAEKIGAPAGALSPPLVASRANVQATIALFLPPLLSKRPT